MTDYLEQLLEEQEEEQRAWEWKWPAARRNGELTGRVSPVQTEEVYAEQVRWAGSEPAKRKGTHTEHGEGERMAQEYGRMELLSGQAGRLRRAVEQMHRQPRGSVLGETDIGPGRGGRLPGTAGAVSRAADYAALVDAAFARDARRYDGPLCLL